MKDEFITLSDGSQIRKESESSFEMPIVYPPCEKPYTLEELIELISKADSLSVKLRVAYTFHCEGVESPRYCLQAIAQELERVACDISILAEKKSDSVRTMDVDSILDGTYSGTGCFSKGTTWDAIVESARAAKALGQQCIQVGTSTAIPSKSDSTGRAEPKKGYFGGTHAEWEKHLYESSGEASQDY